MRAEKADLAALALYVAEMQRTQGQGSRAPDLPITDSFISLVIS